MFKKLLPLVGASIAILPTFLPDVAFSQAADQVEVRLRTFIPSPAVSISNEGLATDFGCRFNNGLCIFSGDGRSFSYNAGTHRTLQNTIVNLAPQNPPAIGVPVRNFCETKSYLPSQGSRVAGQPFWWWTIKPNQSSRAIGKLALAPSNNNVSVERVNNTTVRVALVLDASNPLVTGSPGIGAGINIFLRKQNGVNQYRVEGIHDGFPAYELYINGTPVYQFDPKARAQNPLSLGPPREWNVQDVSPQLNNWRNVPNQFVQQPLPLCP